MHGYTLQQASDELQELFLSASILIQFDRTLKTMMATDTTNEAIDGILSS